MLYIIIAQIARGAVIWTTTHLGRKIFKTIAVGAITFYLVGRHRENKKRDERRLY